MKPIVSIIMGSTSDLPIMGKAAQVLDDFEIPFEMNALSAHRTPAQVEEFASNAAARGLKVIIAAAGMAVAKDSNTFNAAYILLCFMVLSLYIFILQNYAKSPTARLL